MHEKFYVNPISTAVLAVLAFVIAVLFVTDAIAASQEKEGNTGADAIDYVAVVNDKKISMEEFRRNIDMVKSSYDEMGFNLEDHQLDELKKIILDSLIEKELLLQESRAKGIQIDPAAIEAEIDDIKNDFQGAEGFEQRIEEMGYSLDFLRNEIRSNMTIEALIEQELASKVDVSDEEIQSFYDTKTEDFRIPERIRARHILIGKEPGDRKKIEDIRVSIIEGADFEKLAKEHSDCPSKQRGGDLGYFSRGQMVEAFEDAAFALEIGEVSDVVETRFGYHIIQLEDRQAEETKPIEAVRDTIEKEIRRQAVADRLQPYIESLKQKYTVEIMLPDAQ